MTYTTIQSILAANLETNPDRQALVFGTRRYTYRELGEQVNRLTEQLAALGVRKGDKVAIALPNWPEFVFSYFAILRLGAVVVLVNPRYREMETRHILRDSESVAIILPVEFDGFDYLPTIQKLRPDLPALRHVIAVGGKNESADSGSLDGLSLDGGIPIPPGHALDFDELISRARGNPIPEADIDPATDIAVLMYTSGTTSAPKGAMITHSNFVWTTQVASEPFQITSADVFLVLVPTSHIIGFFCLNCAFYYHAKVILADIFKAEPILELIEREKVTVQYAVPTIYSLELASADKYDISSLRTGLVAGAGVPAELIRRLIARGVHALIGYGMTEHSGGIANTLFEDDAIAQTETVGRALPGVALKLVDDNRRAVPDGQVGEIAIKSAGVMKGYYKQPEATAAAFDADGWFYTGDLGCRDERGYIRIVGRKKDMIIRGGYNIYPLEIEDLLRTCPGVLDAVVVAVADPVLGEKTCACIRARPNTRPTAAEIKDFCRGKLADYKVPDYVWFVEQFPETATGKILKARLKEQVDRAVRETATQVYR
ncbi:MAG: AMP-binding protein [Chloroflexi bacterium]|nr:AMP-binding protein [Chloroflexota bacterium]